MEAGRKRLLRSLTPGRWRRFFGHPIYWPLFQLSHCFRYGAFELRIASRNNVSGPVLDVDVWPHALIFHRPLAVARKEAAARCDHRTSVNKRWRVGGMNESAPGSFPNQQADLAALEHV